MIGGGAVPMWLSGLGLCRTCEIFGVSELVLPNLAVVEDPQFTALSVSSQHWLKISEVSKTALSLSTYAVCAVFTESLRL